MLFCFSLFLFIYLTSFHQEEKKTYTSKFLGENKLIQTKVKNKIFKFIYQKNITEKKREINIKIFDIDPEGNTN